MILIVVLDGLRSDQMTKEHMPNLCRLAQKGIRFLRHHATFPTETRVNVASLVTGCYPSGHGLVGNQFYIHEDGSPLKIDTGNRHSIAFLDEVTKGNALQRKSLGEILGQRGKMMVSINVGSSGCAYLNNHKAEETGGLIINPQFTIPAAVAEKLHSSVGAWSPKGIPNSAQIHHATTIMMNNIISKYDPTVTVLWLSDQDSTQHKTSVSSRQALAAINQVDLELGRITKNLEAKGLATSTDILVVSDHGQSTVTRTVDVAAKLLKAGLKESPESTDVLLTGKGGCVLIYVQDHNQAKVKAITEFLTRQSWCGPIFTSSFTDPVPYTFPLHLILNQNSRSPDILMSFAWESSPNLSGINGVGVFAQGNVGVGGGNHGSISPYEINNVLVATGPHFKQRTKTVIPSGTVDLLPTILHLLGLTPPEAVDGRVLVEALEDGPNPEEIFIETYVHEAADRTGNTTFKQRVQISTVDQTVYLDKGRVVRDRNSSM
ncbi:MAG: alkaline phosphatase family protein [Candidatus Thorarchaeota archaeon]